MNSNAFDRRRRTLLKALACAPWVVCAANAQPPDSGCLLVDDRAGRELLLQSRLGQARGGQILESSGDSRFDRALGAMLADLATRFQVRPGFGFYSDDGSPNALALPQGLLADSQGSVLVGRTLLGVGMHDDYGDLFMMGVCAHEFAHIVQFFSNYKQRLDSGQATKKRLELHADFLSGYYLGLRDARYSRQELVALGRSWESLGDSRFNDAQHHGTAEERLQAIEAGFKFARERPEFGVMAACEVGARYLGA